MIEYHYMNWESSYNETLKLFEKIKEDNFLPDIVIGIARGGWIPARLLADFFVLRQTANMKVEAYEMIGEMSANAKITQDIEIPIDGKRVLVIDDIADSGASLKMAIESLLRKNPAELKTATLFYKKTSVIIPDYYNFETAKWEIFPWETFETIKELAATFTQEGLKEMEIKHKLRDIGLPVGIIESYYHSLTI